MKTEHSIRQSPFHTTDHLAPGPRTPSRNIAAATLTISALIWFIITLSVARYFGVYEFILANTRSVLELLEWKKAEYGFFIGSTFLSLLLLQKRRWFVGTCVFLVGVFWVSLHPPVTDYLSSLGTDSFNESRNFDIDEARFWVTTLTNVIRPIFNVPILSFYVLLSLVSFLSLKWLAARTGLTTRYFPYITFVVAFAFIGAAIYSTTSHAMSLFLSNSERFLSMSRNFETAPPSIQLDDKAITLVAYIGESTSIMNMGLYGYPRNTTPRLDELNRTDSNLLLFDNVFSTHTHTSPSLMEALSFAVNEDENDLPIEERKRVSIVDVLGNGDIVPTLISNQGMAGSWNRTSSIIFRNAQRTFSVESSRAGNYDKKLDRPWDHDFFSAFLTKNIDKGFSGKRIIFLHSYAGHGEYLEHIPESFRDPVDNSFERDRAESIVGRDVELLDAIEAYDSTIKYIDFSVSNSIRIIKNSREPIIFLYFPDHGEAVYTGRAHDSARFIHEMARVPLLLYFNDAARAANHPLYEKYKVLAGNKRVSTLAQIPSTLLDLMGVKLADEQNAAIVQTPVLGEEAYLPPILVRRTTEGITYVNINGHANDTLKRFDGALIEKSDDATKMFVITVNHVNESPSICYHRSNTLGKALRGRLVSNCMEIDLIADSNGKLFIHHPGAENAGLELDMVFDLAIESQNALWISGKNLDTSRTCSTLLNFLKSAKPASSSILVEFPFGAHKNGTELDSCANAIMASGFFTSYHVPSGLAKSCSQELKNGQAFDSVQSCRTLKQDLELAFEGGLFTDLSFDYSGIRAVENIEVANLLQWNAWDVAPQSFDKIKSEKFRMISLRNSDPNSL